MNNFPTLGDLCPRLKQLPGHERIAELPIGEAFHFPDGQGLAPPPKESKVAPPSFVGKVAAFGNALVDHARDGFREATPEVQATRKAICLACPHVAKEGSACSYCGCGVNPALSMVGLDMDEKRKWASSACPLTPPKWERS